jgi:hypothetical protein
LQKQSRSPAHGNCPDVQEASLVSYGGDMVVTATGTGPAWRLCVKRVTRNENSRAFQMRFSERSAASMSSRSSSRKPPPPTALHGARRACKQYLMTWSARHRRQRDPSLGGRTNGKVITAQESRRRLRSGRDLDHASTWSRQPTILARARST